VCVCVTVCLHAYGVALYFREIKSRKFKLIYVFGRIMLGLIT